LRNPKTKLKTEDRLSKKSTTEYRKRIKENRKKKFLSWKRNQAIFAAQMTAPAVAANHL